MKLAVFKDYGVGRYFAQLFDSRSLAICQTTHSLVTLFVPVADTYCSVASEDGLVLKAVPEKKGGGRE